MKSRRLALLITLPLLLLVPLVVIKRQSDHPPLSKMDQQVRAQTADAAWVYISGTGGHWRQLTKLKDNAGFLMREPATLRNLVETLRCTTEETKSVMGNYDSAIKIAVPTPGSASDEQEYTWFTYFHCAQGDYLGLNTQEYSANGVRVQPRFAPRFEALVAHLAQRVQVKGKHPEIVMKSISESPN